MKTLTKTGSIVSFLGYVRGGINCWVKAGRVAVQAIDADENWIDRVCDAALAVGLRIVTPQLVRKFERIGRGQLLPLLAYESGAWVSALSRLPYGEQENYTRNPVTVLIPEKGGYVPHHSEPRALTAGQVRQVFARDHVRTEAEQRNYLAEHGAEVPTPVFDLPYRIVRGKIVVMSAGWTLGREDLLRLLSLVTAD